jgi:hypothetical protein
LAAAFLETGFFAAGLTNFLDFVAGFFVIFFGIVWSLVIKGLGRPQRLNYM